MKNEKSERKFDFRPMGLAIKKAREKKGMTQEQLADIIGRDTRTVMYHENDGQHPSLDIFYQLATMFDLSVDEYFYPDMSADEAAKKRINILLNSLSENELRLVEGIINAIIENRGTEGAQETALPPFFVGVPGERVSGKQGKCIDTCNFRAAETLVGVPPNPLDFWPP